MTDKRLRIMLIFANPHQRVLPVPPYGLERISTAIADLGHDVRIEDPFLFDDIDGQDPIAVVAERARAFAPDIIGLSIRNIDDCLVVPDPDGAHDFVTTSFIPEILRLRYAVAEAAPEAVLIAGGASFSMMPAEVMKAIDLPLGIVGTGEASFRMLVQRLAAGKEIGRLPGLIRRGDENPISQLTVTFNDRPTIRDPRYAPTSFYAVRTRFGCAQKCSYCLLSNYERVHADGPLEVILQEVQQAIALGRARGMDRVPVMFSDEEFNLPNETHAIDVLRGIDERGLAEHLFWRAYLHPTPLSDELAELVGRTHGFLSITVDSAAPSVMRANGKPFARKHVDAMVERLDRHRILPFLGFLFGLPGETKETIEETVSFIRNLPDDFLVNYEVGLRVYPGTPLSVMARQDPQHLIIPDGAAPLDPIVYCSPYRPRDLARYLREQFADRPNVKPTGPAYRTAPRLEAAAYRLLREEGPDNVAGWQALLDATSESQYPDDFVESFVGLAHWHGREGLAAMASKRLEELGGAWQPQRVPGQ